MSAREFTERDQPHGGDDALLLRRFVDGDRDALAEFVRRWETPMLKIACRIVGQIADAEEVRQSVLLRIVQEPERVMEVRNVAAWLRRCVVNEAITSIRTRERQHCEPLSEAIGTTPNGTGDDDSRMLFDAMQMLDPPTRAMLSLRFDEGLTIREIADVLETPHTTIQSQLQSAVAALRSRLNAATCGGPNMIHEPPPPEDELDLRKLFERTAPADRPVDVDELIGSSQSRRLDESDVRSDPLPNVWRKLMTRRNGLTAIGVAACALVAAIIGIVESRSGYAFADVKEEVEATKSVSYTETRTDGRHDETARHADMVVTELEHELRNIEEKLESAEGDEKEQLLEQQQRYEEMLDRALRRIQIQGDEPWQTQVMILGRYRQRVERPDVLGDHVSITNMETGESIVVNHEKRSVQRLTRQITIDEETGERNEYEITGNTSVDFYGMLRDLPDDAVELPDRKIVDGVELIGFQSVEEVGADTWTRTVWVDPETRLPRESHTRYRSSNPRHGDSDWFFSDIEFDVPLDESLFSTEPPAGYTVTESSIMGIIPSDADAR